MPGSGADIEYERQLARAGANSGAGLDSARLEQIGDRSEARNSGLPVKRWVAGNDVPTVFGNFIWMVELNFGDPVPSWVPVGSLILRK